MMAEKPQIGHVGWSPDFEGKPVDPLKQLEEFITGNPVKSDEVGSIAKAESNAISKLPLAAVGKTEDGRAWVFCGHCGGSELEYEETFDRFYKILRYADGQLVVNSGSYSDTDGDMARLFCNKCLKSSRIPDDMELDFE